MPSIQARLFNPIVRLLVKRHDWGADEYAVARRARRLFGASRISQWLAAKTVNVTPVEENGVRGEWVAPKTPPSDAILLYIHGGGFVSCSPATHRPITAALARTANLKVFSADYRLAPEHRFPAAIDDVYAAFKWLCRETSSRKIAVAGDSAGGGLTLSLLLRLRGEDAEMPACAVCFSPWTDMTGSGDSVRANADNCQMFYPETVGQFARAYLSNEADARNPLASPVFADFDGFPPVLFHVGSPEILIDDSRRIHEKILQAGGASELEIYDGVFHCWQMGARLIPEADRSIRRAAEFIHNHTSGRDTATK